MFKYIKLSTLSLMALFLFTACNFDNAKPSDKQDQTTKQAEVNKNANLKKAPEFEVTTINDQKISMKQSLADNKPTMIYFMASWCSICAQNWEALKEVYPDYKDRVDFVAISIDPTDDKETISKLAEERSLNFPLVEGTPQVMLDFGVNSQATTVGVNEDGYITFQKNKTILTAVEYRNLFEQLLN